MRSIKNITLGLATVGVMSPRGSDPSPKIPVNVLYSRNIVNSCFWGPSEAEDPQHPISNRNMVKQEEKQLLLSMLWFN